MPYDANGNWKAYEPPPPPAPKTGYQSNDPKYMGANDDPGWGDKYNPYSWMGEGIDKLSTWASGGGPTEVARYGGWDEANMQSNRNAQEAARNQQGWLGEQYKNQIAGKGPSVAENQMRAGQEQAMANQISMSRGGRGPLGQGNAQYNAQVNLANQSQQVNRDAATLRAQEHLGAMQNYGQLSGQMRGQDIDMFGGEASYQKAKADSFNAWANSQAVADESAKTRKGGGVLGIFTGGGGVGSLL